MRRTTPDLTGQRKTIFRAASAVLLGLTVLYALWTNYVAFVGGNLPLTPIDLGEGSVGFGLVMLPIGDLILVLVLWVVVDAVLLNLLHMVLLAGQRPSRPSSIPPQGNAVGQPGQIQPGQIQPGQAQPGQAQPAQQWQPVGPQGAAQGQPWQQPGQPQQWQQQPAQHQQPWQEQPWQQQPWQQQPAQQQPAQQQGWQQQPWPGSGQGQSPSGSGDATLVGHGSPNWPPRPPDSPPSR